MGKSPSRHILLSRAGLQSADVVMRPTISALLTNRRLRNIGVFLSAASYSVDREL